MTTWTVQLMGGTVSKLRGGWTRGACPGGTTKLWPHFLFYSIGRCAKHECFTTTFYVTLCIYPSSTLLYAGERAPQAR